MDKTEVSSDKPRNGGFPVVVKTGFAILLLTVPFNSDRLLAAMYDLPPNQLTAALLLGAERWDNAMKVVGAAELGARARAAASYAANFDWPSPAGTQYSGGPCPRCSAYEVRQDTIRAE